MVQNLAVVGGNRFRSDERFGPAGDRAVAGADEVGPGQDRLLLWGETALDTPQILAAIRRLGFDPAQRRCLSHDGAEAELLRIANPDKSYFAPALLLVPGRSVVSVEYSRFPPPSIFQGVHDLAIFRCKNGEIGFESMGNGSLCQTSTAHFGSDVAAEVWTAEIVLCARADKSYFRLAVEREPYGLYAFGHAA